MMLRYSFGMAQAADDIRGSITKVLDEGWRTVDIADAATPPDRKVGTAMMGDLVVRNLYRRVRVCHPRRVKRTVPLTPPRKKKGTIYGNQRT